MRLPSYIKKVLKIFANHNYEAYVVGGAVRDFLLGKVATDYDISTNAKPHIVKELFANYHTLDVGIKHGTITIFIEGNKVEITTFRQEDVYVNHRKPAKVHFVSSLQVDLMRRDFTINALAYNQELIDLVGGIDDLNSKIIRAIANPAERFQEDALRILRALRFASELGFQIEPKTEAAMIEQRGLLQFISYERINYELNRILAARFGHEILDRYFLIIEVFIPEYTNLDYSKVLMSFSYLPTLLLRQAAFFMPLSNSEAIMRRLKYNNDTIKRTQFLIRHLDLNIPEDEVGLLNLLLEFDYDDLINLISFKSAFNLVVGKSTESLIKKQKILEKLKAEHKVLRIKDLKINGYDLIDLGYQEGINIREVLTYLLEEVVHKRLLNERDVLIKRAMSLLEEK